jgi:hypothetical protein
VFGRREKSIGKRCLWHLPQSKLFFDGIAKAVSHFGVSRDRSLFPVLWIGVAVVSFPMTHQITFDIDKFSEEIAAFHVSISKAFVCASG